MPPASGRAAKRAASMPAVTPPAPSLQAKGLGPQRPSHLEYTAPTVDGAGGVVHGREEIDDVPVAGADASRAERRRAEGVAVELEVNSRTADQRQLYCRARHIRTLVVVGSDGVSETAVALEPQYA